MLKQKSVILLALGYASVCLLVWSLTPADYALASNGMLVPGAPLSGVDIKLGKNPGGQASARSAKTDEKGSFTFSDVPAGTYDLTIMFPAPKDNSSARLTPVMASIALTGVEGGKMSKDLEFAQEPPSPNQRVGPARYKNIILKITVSADGPVTGIITERTSAIRLDQKIDPWQK